MGCTDVFDDMWKVSDGCDLKEEVRVGFTDRILLS